MTRSPEANPILDHPIPTEPGVAPPPEVRRAAVDPEVARDHPEKVGKPDGVPHDIIGILAFMIVLTAMAVLGTYLFLGLGAAMIVTGLVTGFMVVHLSRRSLRERTEEARDRSTDTRHDLAP